MHVVCATTNSILHYRKHDYDHYLCTLLLPQAVQPVAWALRAFNVELALVHDVVTEKETGIARVTFWRELIDSVYKVCESTETGQRWHER